MVWSVTLLISNDTDLKKEVSQKGNNCVPFGNIPVNLLDASTTDFSAIGLLKWSLEYGIYEH